MKIPIIVAILAAIVVIVATIGVWMFVGPHQDQVLQIEMRPHPPQPRPPLYQFEFKRAEELWDRDHI